MIRWTRNIAVVILITLIMGEVILQAAALFVRNRATDGWRPETTFRILAVGDSHTHGGGVPADRSYPAQLQRLLDEQQTGVYSVINLGVPGMNTAQVKNRLPRHVARYDPDLVILWCGINDQWNLSEQDVGWTEWSAWLDGAATRLRLYKLARVWFHDRQLERDMGELRDRPVILTNEKGETSVGWGDVVEQLPRKTQQKRDLVELEQRARSNYEAMAKWARAAGVPLVFITYPVNLYGFAAANRAIRDVGERYGVAGVIESAGSISRLSPDERRFRWATHPNGLMYREIARDIVPVVTARLNPTRPDDRVRPAAAREKPLTHPLDRRERRTHRPDTPQRR